MRIVCKYGLTELKLMPDVVNGDSIVVKYAIILFLCKGIDVSASRAGGRVLSVYWWYTAAL